MFFIFFFLFRLPRNVFKWYISASLKLHTTHSRNCIDIIIAHLILWQNWMHAMKCEYFQFFFLFLFIMCGIVWSQLMHVQMHLFLYSIFSILQILQPQMPFSIEKKNVSLIFSCIRGLCVSVSLEAKNSSGF